MIFNSFDAFLAIICHLEFVHICYFLPTLLSRIHQEGVKVVYYLLLGAILEFCFPNQHPNYKQEIVSKYALIPPLKDNIHIQNWSLMFEIS